MTAVAERARPSELREFMGCVVDEDTARRMLEVRAHLELISRSVQRDADTLGQAVARLRQGRARLDLTRADVAIPLATVLRLIAREPCSREVRQAAVRLARDILESKP